MERPLSLTVTSALALVAVAGCEPEAPTQAPASPYVVSVDLAPQIRAFADDTATADEAGELLAQMGDPAIPALAAALRREDDAEVRRKAIEVLGTIGTPAAVPALLAAAEGDADEEARGDALRALGAIGDPRARPVLERALGDARIGIRVGGVMGCTTLCAAPATIERLADIAVHDENPAVALAARTTLRALRQVGAAEDQAVRRAIDARRPLLDRGGADERALIALLASDVDDAAGAPALMATLEAASPMLQRQMSWRLGSIAGAEAVAALGRLLASPDPGVRFYAADALGNLRDRGIESAAQVVAAYAGPKPVRPLGPPEY